MGVQRVLVADNNPLVRSLVRTYLRELDFEVVEAADSERAIAIARTQRLAIVLLDLMLPRHGGIYVMHEIRTYQPVPIVMLSTLHVGEVRELTTEAEAYVRKPFRTSDLAGRVKAIVDRDAPRRRGVRTTPPPTPAMP
jgi:DNA-binding response OmpR family regulator